MNFSQSSDTDYKPTRGRHTSAAQQNNNIFGLEAAQSGQSDQMFPPNRVKANAAEEMAQKQAAQANYERRMEEALANRKHSQTATNIFSQEGPNVSKYSYKASQPAQPDARQQSISNVFGDENINQYQEPEQQYQQQQLQQYQQQPQTVPDRQYSDIFNQQNQQPQQHHQHDYNNINQRQSDIFNQQNQKPQQQQQQHYQHDYNNINQRQSDIFNQGQDVAPDRPASHKKTFQQTRQGFNPITGMDYNDAPVTARGPSNSRGHMK